MLNAPMTLKVGDEEGIETTLDEMKQVVDTIRNSLRIRGQYKGVTHKEIDKRLQYAVKIKVEGKDLDPVDVNLAILAGTCLVTYRVPQQSSHTVQFEGKIDSARPNDGEGIWLNGIEPDYVTFTIHHVAAEATGEMAKLLTLLVVADLTLEALFVPIQGRLL